MRRGLIGGLLAVLLAVEAPAATFDFFWTGDPLADPTLVTSPDATARATGTIEIDAAPGASFAAGNVTAVNLSVTGTVFTDIVFTSIAAVAGTIAADGLSASITDIFFVGGSGGAGTNLFGCATGSSCSPTILVANLFGAGNSVDFVYGSAAEARASIRLTAEADAPAVPLPAPAGALVSALALLVLVRRRR